MCLGLANGCRKPITKKRTYEKLKQTHFPEKNSGAELTREDVIKALECCSAGNCESGNCPLFSPADIDVCTTKLAGLALEIIENDKGKINKLLYENQMLSRHETDLIKELAKRTNEMITKIYNKHIFGNNDLEAEEKDAIINFSDDVVIGFDNLVKEMMGDDK